MDSGSSRLLESWKWVALGHHGSKYHKYRDQQSSRTKIVSIALDSFSDPHPQPTTPPTHHSPPTRHLQDASAGDWRTTSQSHLLQPFHHPRLHELSESARHHPPPPPPSTMVTDRFKGSRGLFMGQQKGKHISISCRVVAFRMHTCTVPQPSPPPFATARWVVGGGWHVPLMSPLN